MRPSSQPWASAAGYTCLAPAATARWISACGSARRAASARAAAQRRRAEVGVRGGLVGDPEPGIADRELGHHGLVGVGAADPVPLDGAERGPVELHGGAAVPDRELGLNPGLGSAAFVAGSVHGDRLTGPAVIPSCQTGSGGFH